MTFKIVSLRLSTYLRKERADSKRLLINSPVSFSVLSRFFKASLYAGLILNCGISDSLTVTTYSSSTFSMKTSGEIKICSSEEANEAPGLGSKLFIVSITSFISSRL